MSNFDISEICARYVSLVGNEDVEALVALFAADATVEDPVGSDVRQGTDALREFYGALPPMGVTAELTGPVRAIPEALTAAFPFKTGSPGIEISVIDVMTFTEEGKIASMKAYWSF